MGIYSECLEDAHMTTKAILDDARNILLAIRRFKNYGDITLSIVQGQNPATVTLRNGLQIHAPKDIALLPMIDDIFFKNVYTPTNLPILGDDVVVDIGANIGVFTLLASSRTQETVHAFEPFPQNVEFLKKNIHMNNLHKVITHRFAVCSEVGSAKLFLSKTSTGHLLFDRNIEGRLSRHIEVPTTTLQRIIDDNALDRIGFLKLDCEGSEGSILVSTPVSYFKTIRKIAMEFHDNVAELKHDDIVGFLREAGFATTLNWDGKSPFGYLYGRRG
jgi:FkbM family methyltransferase